MNFFAVDFFALCFNLIVDLYIVATGVGLSKYWGRPKILGEMVVITDESLGYMRFSIIEGTCPSYPKSIPVIAALQPLGINIWLNYILFPGIL